MAAPDVEAWDAWTPWEAARRLEGVGRPWMVAGGWALDLGQGRETRPHEDLEVAISRVHFDAFRAHLKDYPLFTAGGGELAYLPPETPPPTEHHQNWVLDPQENVWRLDLFLEPGDDETWVCRRDEAGIRLPRREVVGRTPAGIPFLLPQFVLLFKAKATRPKDEQDFASAFPLLDRDARRWLCAALERLHPGHPWIGILGRVP